MTLAPERSANQTTPALSLCDVEDGLYISTSAPTWAGKTFINARLLADLASGRNVLVIEGPVREGLLAAGWAEAVTDLFIRGTESLTSAYLDALRVQSPHA